MSVEHQFQLALLEAQQSQLRARYYEQRIATGTWRERIGKVFRGGLPEHGGVPFTEIEILRDEVNTMYRHIDWAEQHLEAAKGHMDALAQNG